MIRLKKTHLNVAFRYIFYRLSELRLLYFLPEVTAAVHVCFFHLGLTLLQKQYLFWECIRHLFSKGLYTKSGYPGFNVDQSQIQSSSTCLLVAKVRESTNYCLDMKKNQPQYV